MSSLVKDNTVKLESLISVQVKEKGGKLFHCQACTYSSSKRYCVKRHLSSVHAPDEKIRCTTCDSTYKNRRCFMDHLHSQSHMKALRK
jgi:hypothetical protein